MRGRPTICWKRDSGFGRTGANMGISSRELKSRLVAAANGEEAYKKATWDNPGDTFGAIAAREKYSKESFERVAYEVLRDTATKNGLQGFRFAETKAKVHTDSGKVEILGDSFQFASSERTGLDATQRWIVNVSEVQGKRIKRRVTVEQKRFATPIEALRYAQKAEKRI